MSAHYQDGITPRNTESKDTYTAVCPMCYGTKFVGFSEAAAANGNVYCPTCDGHGYIVCLTPRAKRDAS